jgi:hypothetical protein
MKHMKQRFLYVLALLLLVSAVGVGERCAAQQTTTLLVSELVAFSPTGALGGIPAFFPAQGRNGLYYGVLGTGATSDPGSVIDFSAAGVVNTVYTAPPTTVGGQVVLENIWKSSISTSNYGPGAVKFAVPTVANGLVFVPGGASGYAPGAPDIQGSGANCTATALATQTTPACQGLVSVYGKLHNP